MTRAADVPDISAIEAKLVKLQAALSADLPRERRLRRWSEFIRERDGHRCVDCHSRRRLSAHHICRKSFLAEPQFETGNGITLCSACHREVHRGFNARPGPFIAGRRTGRREIGRDGAALQHPHG